MLKHLNLALVSCLVVALLLSTGTSTVAALSHDSYRISTYDIQFTGDASGDSPYVGQVVTAS